MIPLIVPTATRAAARLRLAPLLLGIALALPGCRTRRPDGGATGSTPVSAPSSRRATPDPAAADTARPSRSAARPPATASTPEPGAPRRASARPGSGPLTGRRVRDSAQAARALGHRVRIRGAAANAKLGAVVLRQDLVVYLDGQREWSARVVGRTVEAAGTLVRTSRFRARRGPRGAISQGTAGPVLVLRQPRWRLVPVPRPVRPSRPPGVGSRR